MKVLQPKSVVIKFTEEEATVLCALVGGIASHFDAPAARTVRALYNLLNAELPNRTKSFGDLFEGSVEAKR